MLTGSAALSFTNMICRTCSWREHRGSACLGEYACHWTHAQVASFALSIGGENKEHEPTASSDDPLGWNCALTLARVYRKAPAEVFGVMRSVEQYGQAQKPPNPHLLEELLACYSAGERLLLETFYRERTDALARATERTGA